MRDLTAGEVVCINEAEVGPDLLADFGLLESAVLRPQPTVFGQDAYPDVDTKAAALLHSLIRNHPFVDGNKRTAVIAVLVYYGLNGFWLEAEQNELVAVAVDMAEGILDVAAIARRLKGWVRPLPPEQRSWRQS
ncbi:MAG: type II toxin-antitoxin system death-on-curing family toxin [Actinomycetota bacterium]